MNSNRKVFAISPEAMKPRCKHCQHCVGEAVNGEDGFLCYRYPPIPFIDPDGYYFMVRPEIDENDYACGDFSPNQ